DAQQPKAFRPHGILISMPAPEVYPPVPAAATNGAAALMAVAGFVGLDGQADWIWVRVCPVELVPPSARSRAPKRVRFQRIRRDLGNEAPNRLPRHDRRPPVRCRYLQAPVPAGPVVERDSVPTPRRG